MRVSARVDRRKRKRRDIPSKLRDDPWPWLKRRKSQSWRRGGKKSRQSSATANIAFHIKQLFPTFAHPFQEFPLKKFLGRPSAPFRRCQGTTSTSLCLFHGAWARAVRKEHGGDTPMALLDHGHLSSFRRYKTSPSSKKPSPQLNPLTSLVIRMAPGDGEVPYGNLNIGGREYILPTEP